jgi:hypothetical protein
MKAKKNGGRGPTPRRWIALSIRLASWRLRRKSGDITPREGPSRVRFGLENQVGQDARVRTGDEEPLRSLHLGKEMEVIALLGEDFVVKAPVPFASCRVQGAVK